MRVQRVDRFALDFERGPPTEVSGGMVEVWGVATRVGVFDYDDEHKPGEVFRELRPRAEVMDAASLRTLRGSPFTLDHPASDVTADNARDLVHGWIMDVEPAGDLVWTRVRVATRDALSMIQSGTVELSCGYTAALEDRSGLTADGDRYDAIQREIRYNHLALVDVARAGPVARLKLDRAANLRVYRRDQRKRTPMKTITFRHDGKSHKLPAYCGPGLYEEAQLLEGRKDQIETAKVMLEIDGETVELVLPKATVENMLAVAGAAGEAAPEPPAEDPVEAPPVEEAAPDGFGNPEEEEDAAEAKPNPFARMDAAAVEKIVDARVGKAIAEVRADAKTRRGIERDAVRILDAGYRWEDSTAWQIAADVIAHVDESMGTEAKAFAARADSKDPAEAGEARGWLRARFADAVKRHGDEQDRSGEVLDALGHRDGVEVDDDSPDFEAAQRRYHDRLRGVKPANESTDAA